jgi:release factor glutamine methyltransferase
VSLNSPNIAALLAEAQRQLGGRGITGDAAVLLAGVLGVDRAALLARDGDIPEAGTTARFRGLVARRAAGEPVAQLLGHREFHGLFLRVTPAVLVPRPETELLVELALARLPTGRPPRVADLGTGSGAIALALARLRPDLHVTATDASAAALAVAADNANRLGIRNLRFYPGDWCAALPADLRFDIIVSNPPYLAADDPHLDVGDLRYEPRLALVGGIDGLASLRRIITCAPAHLVPGGWLLLEHGGGQGAAVRAQFGPGWADATTWPDLAGLPRVTGARHT